MPADWISPTSHVDPGGKWYHEDLVYDGNVGTTGTCLITANSWSTFLELYVAAPTSSSKLRYNFRDAGFIDIIDCDIETGGGWVHVYEGPVEGNHVWVERAFASCIVTGIRVRCHVDYGTTLEWDPLFYEAELWEEDIGWTGKIAGVTDPAKIAGVAVADIAEVKGVA